MVQDLLNGVAVVVDEKRFAIDVDLLGVAEDGAFVLCGLFDESVDDFHDLLAVLFVVMASVFFHDFSNPVVDVVDVVDDDRVAWLGIVENVDELFELAFE